MSCKRASKRSLDEWMEMVTVCRQSGLTDADWCAEHGIAHSSFYNAVTRLRKQACQIPDPIKKASTLDLTSRKQDVVRIAIEPENSPEELLPNPMDSSMYLDNSNSIVAGDSKIKVTMNEKLIKKNLELAGYNLLVTSEITMSDKDVYDAYHNLWRIEESFRIMKSQLDARPVYLQKEDTIVGHFLICYLAVLLTRLLQFNILKNSYCSEDLFEFIRDFRVAKISDRKYINLSRGTTFIKEFAALCNLPLTSYFLSDGEIKKMLSHRF